MSGKGFSKKTVVVTGGSRGIGRACCLAFAREGANIAFTYHKNKEKADSLKKELDELGVQSLSLQADIREYDRCRNVIKEVCSHFTQVGVLINNAGIVKDRALMMMSPDDWKEVIDTNLTGTFNMTRAVITSFLKQKNGCIINISSVSGIVGIPRQTNYSAAKAGIIGFTKALAKEVAAYNVRVNAVCPGYIDTEMLNGIPENIKEEITKNIPVGRIGQPEEIAQLCVYLASDKGRYIIGDIIKIDGGLAI
ncbi:MAG: 3-oxoacyl-[acyl-carrier-protein] reductase [Candidatus Omnitrophica bacterium]|nr:3-oxoacyl-[acyl-carrier-protein] reductase [Candidatus Omnitrophota bacterium]